MILKGKDWGLENETKVNSEFLLMKSSKNVLFFYLHFTSLYGS